MDTPNRDINNYMTAAQGEQPYIVRGRAIRKISIESLSVLQLIESPFAKAFGAALNGHTPDPVNPGPLDCALLAWAHAENPDTVLQAALACQPGFLDPAIQPAMQFVREWSMEDIGAVLSYTMADVNAVQAAAFDAAAPEYGKPGLPKKA